MTSMLAALQRAKILELQNWVWLGIVLLVGIPVLEYSYKSYMRIYEDLLPVKAYFEYRVVSPKQAAYRMCDDLTVTSYSRQHKESIMSYTDTLRCDSGDGFYAVGSDLWAPELKPANDYWITGFDWTYQGPRPSKNSLCYFRSTVCATLEYGSDKCDVVKSERFRLNGTQEDCDRIDNAT